MSAIASLIACGAQQPHNLACARISLADIWPVTVSRLRRHRTEALQANPSAPLAMSLLTFGRRASQ